MKSKFNFRSSIPWYLFWKNQYDRSALHEYAVGKINTWKAFLNVIQSPECKQIVRQLKGSGYGVNFWRDRAAAALRRNGITVTKVPLGQDM